MTCKQTQRNNGMEVLGTYNITCAREPSDFVWFRVAKTGTRSVFKILRRNYVTFEVENGFHVPLLRHQFLGYFSFTFVRNPYTRLVSGWKNKVVDGAPGGGLRKVQSPDRLKNFEYFVEWLVDQEPNEMNIHYRPQTLLVPDKVDFIGRTETFTSDLRFVLSRIGLDADQEIPHDNQSGAQPISIQDISARSLSSIHSLYSEDFERFGYSMLS